MEEQLVTKETAILAQKVGFDIQQKSRYVEILSVESVFIHKIQNPEGVHLPWIQDPSSVHKVGDILCSNVTETDKGINAGHYKEYGEAPTQSLLKKWLRDVHKIDIWETIVPVEAIKAYNKAHNTDYLKKYGAEIYIEDNIPKISSKTKYSDVYEEALEGGLKMALNYILEK